MKNGKKPTRNQRKLFVEVGLNPKNWLIVKNQSDEMTVIHRETGRIKAISI